MSELSAWAKKNSKIVVLDDGETLEAVYEDYKIVANSFDPEKEIVMYRLKIDQDGAPAVKSFRSASGRAARFFGELEKGTSVKITRHGKGPETKYDFSVANGPTPTDDESDPF